jgi:SNW domain-containing protein 1
VNEKFAKFADTLYITERQARTEIEERNKVQQSIAYKDYLNREQSMREKAKKVKEE